MSLAFLSTSRPTTDTHSLSLHDALPIWQALLRLEGERHLCRGGAAEVRAARPQRHRRRQEPLQCLARSQRRPTVPAKRSVPDRKSTRLNSSHLGISYAVFCLKKKTTTQT